MDSQSKLKDYMSQMRVMEDKLRETKLQAKFDEYSQLSYDEFEKEEKLRREEDELRHLRELQEEERRRREAVQAQYARMQYSQPYGAPVPYNYAAELARQKQAIEMQQLAILQEQVRVQEEENRRLQERLNSMRVQPVYQYPMPSPYPQPQPSPYPQQPPVMMMSPPVQYPTQVYFIQNNEPTSKAKTNESPLSKESKIESDERDKPSDTAVSVDAVAEEKKEVVVETDQNVERNIEDEFDAESDIRFNERLSFADLYVLLSNEQKQYCDELRDYAKKKSGAKEFPAKYHLSVGNGQKVIVKMTIKNGICFAQFRLEDERLRSIRRNATTSGADIQIKETKVPLLDESALCAAKEMVDLRLVQLEEYVLLQKQRAAERRKAAKPD